MIKGPSKAPRSLLCELPGGNSHSSFGLSLGLLFCFFFYYYFPALEVRQVQLGPIGPAGPPQAHLAFLT